jgi:hypothetical protein
MVSSTYFNMWLPQRQLVSVQNIFPATTEVTVVSCRPLALLKWRTLLSTLWNMNVWCNQIVSGLCLFLHNNNTYLVINVVPFKVVSLGLYTASLMIAQPSEAFCEKHYLKLGKWVPWFCLNHGDIKSFSLYTTLSFGKRKNSCRAKSIK